MKNKDVKGTLKRTQKDYSLAFKLQVVNEIEKGCLTYKESQKKYEIYGKSLVWLRKRGISDWKSKTAMKSKQPPKTIISQLEAKIKRLQAEKEILNCVIDIADSTMNAEIRKKHLPLLQEASKSQRQNPDTSLS